jgi:hypothetical protein
MSGSSLKNAPWSIRIFGETGVSYIGLQTDLLAENEDADRRLRMLRRLFPEARIVPFPHGVAIWAAGEVTPKRPYGDKEMRVRTIEN